MELKEPEIHAPERVITLPRHNTVKLRVEENFQLSDLPPHLATALSCFDEDGAQLLSVPHAARQQRAALGLVFGLRTLCSRVSALMFNSPALTPDASFFRQRQRDIGRNCGGRQAA